MYKTYTKKKSLKHCAPENNSQIVTKKNYHYYYNKSWVQAVGLSPAIPRYKNKNWKK